MRFDGPFSMVLGGGGLKGMAHIGVFQALEELGMTPELVVGCSMGSLIAAAWCAGVSPERMGEIALEVQRKDVFRIAHLDMAFKRMHALAVYRPEPLDALIHRLVGDITFKELKHRLVVATVDLNTGGQVLWGQPGLDHVRVADAVFASCALPGLFPPRDIDGRLCVDGAVIENLPVRVAASLVPAPVIAVHVGATTTLRSGTGLGGFAATYARGLELVMHAMLRERLHHWRTPPLMFVHPRVEHISMFSFSHTRELIDEGYRSTIDTFGELPTGFPIAAEGIFPRRDVVVSVDPKRCVGCGACVMWAPEVFRMGADGKAEVVASRRRWSPIDGQYVRHCPTWAI
ncbi:MAG: patatin-like phospholipase family protein, partial [Gemmatimonadota bacterium]